MHLGSGGADRVEAGERATLGGEYGGHGGNCSKALNLLVNYRHMKLGQRIATPGDVLEPLPPPVAPRSDEPPVAERDRRRVGTGAVELGRLRPELLRQLQLVHEGRPAVVRIR